MVNHFAECLFDFCQLSLAEYTWRFFVSVFYKGRPKNWRGFFAASSILMSAGICFNIAKIGWDFEIVKTDQVHL